VADREIKLPSGKTAVVRDGKGKDLRMAQRKAQTPDDIAFALISELVTLDGQPIIYEDLDEMVLKDVLMLVTEVSGNFPTLPPRP